MPATARDLQVADPLDALENILGDIRYLRYLLDIYGWKLELSIAAYNAGPVKVKGHIPNIVETGMYIAKVLDIFFATYPTATAAPKSLYLSVEPSGVHSFDHAELAGRQTDQQ